MGAEKLIATALFQTPWDFDQMIDGSLETLAKRRVGSRCWTEGEAVLEKVVQILPHHDGDRMAENGRVDGNADGFAVGRCHDIQWKPRRNELHLSLAKEPPPVPPA